MSHGSDPETDPLRRAREHLRRATLEGLEAASALLEVALRAGSLYPAARDSLVGEAQHTLNQLIEALREERELRLPEALAAPLAEAIEREIARWERRSQTDSDARPVLRAFLGLRELLWEFGVRRPGGREAAAEPASKPNSTRPGKPKPARVQRFDIEDS
jgi:hypothetical protein